MSQNVTHFSVYLLLFPFVEARKVGPKSHKASLLRQLHSKKLVKNIFSLPHTAESGENRLLTEGKLQKQIVDRKCFLWSLGFTSLTWLEQFPLSLSLCRRC